MSLRRLWVWIAICALVGCSDESVDPGPDFVHVDITLIVPRTTIDGVAALTGADPTAISIGSSLTLGYYFEEEPITEDGDQTFNFETLCDGSVTATTIDVALRVDRGQVPNRIYCYEYVHSGELPCETDPYTIQWKGAVGCWQ